MVNDNQCGHFNNITLKYCSPDDDLKLIVSILQLGNLK
jgi:hypothetical protein